MADLLDNQTRTDIATLLDVDIHIAAQTTKLFTVPVDSSLSEITFSLRTGVFTRVERPDGSVVQYSDPGVTHLPLLSGDALTLSVPAQGTWRVTVGQCTDSALRITGRSDIDCTIEFTELKGAAPHGGYESIDGAPLQGNIAHIEANIPYEPVATANFEIRSADGTFIQTLSLPEEQQPEGDSFHVYFGDVTLPTTPFSVYVTGLTTAGQPYQRVVRGSRETSSVKVVAPDPFHVRPGISTRVTFHVTNLGQADVFQVTVSDTIDAVAQVIPSSFALGSGQSADVVAYVIAPCTIGNTDPLNVPVHLSVQGALSSNTSEALVLVDPFTVSSNAPELSTGEIVRHRGGVGITEEIATAWDTDPVVGDLVIVPVSVPVGINVTNIQNDHGSITANVRADCFATPGSNIVALEARGGSCSPAVASLYVTVIDDPPLITCPADITVNLNGPCSAAVVYPLPSASTVCGGPSVVCSPASGSTFLPGTTTVTCTASSSSGAVSQCSFRVIMRDTVRPTLSCPANTTVDAPANQCAATVSYVSPTASDNCAGVTVACTPASGSSFPVGVTTVTCTANDVSNNNASCTFTVTVRDRQSPSVQCPANIVKTADRVVGSTFGATVTYTPAISDSCPGATITCTPSSGSVFTLGTSTVTCIARDTSGNTSTCSFTVTVNMPTHVCLFANPHTTNDQFLEIVQAGNPLYGYWKYTVGNTGQVFSGYAEYVVLTNIKLLSYDHDSTVFRMDTTVQFSSNYGSVTVVELLPNPDITAYVYRQQSGGRSFVSLKRRGVAGV